ncbi:MAG: class I SAM-dependent methyltransferase [Minisyncoccia bacterium]
MFSDPIKNIEQCGIQAGMDIADFGSGSGHYSMAASRALISTGRVYAIDVDKELLTRLKNNSTKEGLYNIEVVWGNVEKPNGAKLRDSSVDLVFICNLLFQLDDKVGAIKEAKRILKPGGRVLVIDWSDSFGGIGPKPIDVVKKPKAKELFEKQGFSIDREISAGAHHYGLIFKKM